MKTEMTITDKFDIAKKLVDGGDITVGYEVGGRIFNAYLTNEEWKNFKASMPEDIRKMYDEGRGSEMREYVRDGRTYPPKMASYASSSRFMYEMGKDIEGFVFEKQLETGLGGFQASLDGFVEAKNLFVEAKCHEFYSNQNTVLRKGHKMLYDFITGFLDDKTPSLNYGFRYDAPDGIDGKVSLYWDGYECRNFDLRQMLCHLCGIANYVLKGGNSKVNFIYLIYRPTPELLGKIEKEADRNKISYLFDEEIKVARSIDFQKIYWAVLSYFNVEYHLGLNGPKFRKLAQDFNFIVCTQENFRSMIETL